MKHLLLMRHGEAVDSAPGGDGDRWLTGYGRELTRAVALHLAKHLAPATVWTSPLVRATQTAEIVASAVGLTDRVEVLRALATGDVAVLARRVAAFDGAGPLCLVGHEPTLSALVTQVMGHTKWAGFEKSAVCCLAWDAPARARFVWMLLPKNLRVVTDLTALF